MTNDQPVLSAAIGNYRHTEALKSGRIASDHLRLEFADIPTINRAFAPMVREQRFDVCEMAMATFLQAKAWGKPLVLRVSPGQAHDSRYVEALLEGGAVKRPRRGRPRLRPQRVAGDKGYSYRRVRRYLRRRGIGARLVRWVRRAENRARGDAFIRSGNWYGNQTTWRMCLDLNRIALYGRLDGSIADTPQRRLVHIVDAITEVAQATSKVSA